MFIIGAAEIHLVQYLVLIFQRQILIKLNAQNIFCFPLQQSAGQKSSRVLDKHNTRLGRHIRVVQQVAKHVGAEMANLLRVVCEVEIAHLSCLNRPDLKRDEILLLLATEPFVLRELRPALKCRRVCDQLLDNFLAIFAL